MGMNNSNDIAKAVEIVNSFDKTKVKKIKRENGLIERTQANNEKVILAEDNRQVLFG